MKKSICLLLLSLSLCGCVSNTEFFENKPRYTTFEVGQIYQIKQELVLIEYNYLLIPLVKPGIQLIQIEQEDEAMVAKKFKITGKAHPGDKIKIIGFEVEGGWIPCHGDRFMANPMAIVLSGELRNKTVGISLLCKDRTGLIPYKSGRMYFAEPNSDLLEKVKSPDKSTKGPS